MTASRRKPRSWGKKNELVLGPNPTVVHRYLDASGLPILAAKQGGTAKEPFVPSGMEGFIFLRRNGHVRST